MNGFAPLSGWILTLLVAYFAIKFVRFVFGRWQNKKFHTDTIGKILELAIIAGTVYAIRSVPIISSSTNLLSRLIDALSGNVGQVVVITSSGLILAILTGITVYKYWKTDNEWWTILFAIGILALSVPIPAIATAMEWMWSPLVFFWQVFMTLLNAVANVAFG